MEFTTLKKNLDLVANLFARDIFPECMVSRRLLWQILFSYQCFVNEFCHYLNNKVPGLLPADFFNDLPEEPVLPIIIPIDNYKNSRMVCVFVHDFDAHLEELIVRIEEIIAPPGKRNIGTAYIPTIEEHRISAKQEFGLPITPSHIHQWRQSFPYHNWFRLKDEKINSLK